MNTLVGYSDPHCVWVFGIQIPIVPFCIVLNWNRRECKEWLLLYYPNSECFQGAIMESLDYPLSQDNLLEDQALTRSVARKLSPPTLSTTNDAMTSLPDVLFPDRMMSLTLRADSENNQVKYSYYL